MRHELSGKDLLEVDIASLPGRKPEYIRAVQASLGRDIAIDGIAGEQTLKALETYQNKPIRSDQPSRVTISDTLACGASGPQVMKLQQALLRAGLNPGSPDGIFGPLTAAAVIKFQKRCKILADGIVGPNTINHLKQHL